MCSCVCRWPHTKTKSLKSSGPLPGTVLREKRALSYLQCGSALWLSCLQIYPFLLSLSLHLLVLYLCCGLHVCLSLAFYSPYSWCLLTELVNLPIPAWKPWVYIVPLGELGSVLFLFSTLGQWNCCCFIPQSRLTLVTSWTVAPLSVGFCKQEYWSGLPFSLTGFQTNSLYRGKSANIFRNPCSSLFQDLCVLTLRITWDWLQRVWLSPVSSSYS